MTRKPPKAQVTHGEPFNTVQIGSRRYLADGVRKIVRIADAKTPKKTGKKEHTEQAAFVTRMSFEFKDVLGFGIPNGAKRSAWEARQHNAEGLTSGVPDFYIEEARGGWFGLRLEFKKPSLKPKTDRAIVGGRSKTQISIHERLTEAGYLVFTVYSCEEAMTRVYAYMDKPRTIGLAAGV